MIIFPLYIFLIIYALFLIGFAFFGFFSVYHLLKFGFTTFGTFFLAFIFLGVSVIILFASVQAIIPIDWGNEITMFKYTDVTPYY
ncbi:MAG: hypothetical protein PHW53_00990 [Patescibacteria group bacterium]|nr:hypothetical protein [Patescibacteria group bacterium]